MVAATVCVGNSPTAGVVHCVAYEVRKQSVAIHGHPSGLMCELFHYANNCAEADAALSEACGCD